MSSLYCREPTKAHIRRAVLSRRDYLCPSIRSDFGMAALSRVLDTSTYTSAEVLMAYCSFGSEIETLPLLVRALRDGKRLVLPKINKTENKLELFVVSDLHNDLVPGLWGIKEPDSATCSVASLEQIDLILMPGVAFDKSGGRLGYGRGYYDRLLADCIAAGRRPLTIAAAFSVQIQHSVPMEDHDVRVDILATEVGMTYCSGRTSR